jgi:hypothetical protein
MAEYITLNQNAQYFSRVDCNQSPHLMTSHHPFSFKNARSRRIDHIGQGWISVRGL